MLHDLWPQTPLICTLSSSGAREKASCSSRVQAADRPGETIYKGHRSYDLMLNLQLGVRHAVGALASSVMPGSGLGPADFLTKVRPFTQGHSCIVLKQAAASKLQ